MTKQLKMKVVDWWQPDNEENFYNNYIVKKLKDKYDILYSDKPDFLIYSCFGYKHANYDCVRIFYTGENVRPDFNLADYAISFDYTICEDRHLRAPLPFFTQNKSKELQDVLNTRLHFAKNKTKFCGFVASNGYLTQKRNKFFEALCGYKHVDSGGRYKNNIGGNVLCKMSWLQSYKFNICFENSSYPGYLTEKLFDAFISGCIPIYWGDTSLNCTKNNNISQANNFTFNNTSTQNKVMNNNINNINNDGGGGVNIFDTRIPNIPSYLLDYEINPKAFINAHNFPTFKDLIEEIKRIDNDEKAYLEMLQEPIFLNDFNPAKFYPDRIFQFLDYIIQQGPINARRRGNSANIIAKEELLKQKPFQTFDDIASKRFAEYCNKHRGLIEKIREISETPRNILRYFRGR